MMEAEIDLLLDREQARFAKTHPKSADAWRKGKQHFLYGGPSHWMRRWAGGFPIYVAEATGAEIRDIDGNVYTDFCLGDTGGMCGHAAEPITSAALNQLRRGTTTMLPTEDSLWVGQELSQRFGLPYWLLTTSATDANRAAIRISRMVSQRDKVLVFSGCYHGGVEEAHIELRDGRMAMRNMIHANSVDHSRVSKVVEFNDIPALESALAARDVACVLAEPFMTNFGMIPPVDGFHEALRHITRRTETLLIIDETHTISSGLGGYTQQHGLEPDMFVAGKAIAGGIPCGILGVTDRVAEAMWQTVPWVNPRERQSAHLGFGGTLAGNALTLATMRAVLSEILTQPSYDRMIAAATRLASDARDVIERRKMPWHVTQVGSRVEIMFSPTAPRNGAEVIASRNGLLETLLHAFYLNEGMLVTPFHNMFLMCPATTMDQAAAHADVLERFIDLLHTPRS
jgi:glutamate-1-semialdehyde 2,1-aminomutase